MSGKIFVPLSKRDRIDEIIPYLLALARPEMEVVFLTRYRERVSWMEVELTAIQTGLKLTQGMIQSLMADSRIRDLRVFEEKVCCARDALQQHGLRVSFDCYTGSLRDAIASLSNSDAELVVLMNDPQTTVRILISRFVKLFGGLKSTDTTPILFLRPRRQY